MTRAMSPPSVVNRGLLVALGRYGLRALAHPAGIWSRLQFEDYQRRYLRPGLPSIHRLHRVSLVIPTEAGAFVAGTPNTDDWNDEGFRRIVMRHTSSPWRSTGELGAQGLAPRVILDSLRDDGSKVSLPGTQRERRGGYFRGMVHDQEDRFGEHIGQVAREALVDEDAPGSEINRFTIYIMASLADEFASSLIWPIVMTIRERLTQLPVEVVGLLNTGAFGDRGEITRQQAATYAALQELGYQSGVPVDVSPFDLPLRRQGWRSQSFFDYCFLLDSQKRNGAFVQDEDEIIVCTANLVESMAVSHGLDVISERVGPDQPFLQRGRRFAAVGTASVRIPLDEWGRRNADEFVLETLEGQYFDGASQEAMQEKEAAREAAVDFIADHLTLPDLTRRMVTKCPFRVSEDGDLAGLLREAGQETPLVDEEGPGQPVPEIEVLPEVLRPDLPTFSPDEWLAHLRRHYGNLGLDVSYLSGRGDGPNASSVGGQDRHPSRDKPMDWFDAMLIACDSRNEPELTEDRERPTPGVSPRSESGIVPDFARLLRDEVGLFVRRSDSGLLAAQTFLDRLGGRLRQNVDRLVEYRARINRGLDGAAGAQIGQETGECVLRFQRLVQRRPTVGSLSSRCIMLAALAAVTLFHWMSPDQLLNIIPPHRIARWFARHSQQVWPWNAVALGLLLGVLVAVMVFAYGYLRLRRTIRALDDNLACQVNLAVNESVLTILYDRRGQGLLTNLGLTLRAQQNAVEGALRTLRQHASGLEERLAVPLAANQPAIRQVLPGLDDLRQRLVGETRPNPEDLPSTLLAADPEGGLRWLDAMLAYDTERALIEVGLSDAEPSQVAQQYGEATQGYRSLGDLLLMAVRRIGGEVSEIVPPADLKITSLLEDRIPGYAPRTFLADLSQRAQPTLNWVLENLEPSMPLSTDLLVIEAGDGAFSLQAAAEERRLSVTGSSDPFSITLVQLRYGIPLDAIPQYHSYREAFSAVPGSVRGELVISEQELKEDQYLGREQEGGGT